MTVDDQGNSCQLVEGTVPPGQYKIAYDFGSGYREAEGDHRDRADPDADSDGCPDRWSDADRNGYTDRRSDADGQREPFDRSVLFALRVTDDGPLGEPQTEVEGRVTFRTAHDRADLAGTGLDLTAVLGFAVVLLVSGAVLVAMGRARTRSRST